MQYLITGGGGFIGRAILAEIRKHEPEAEVSIFQRTAHPDLERQGVEVIRGDLTDIEAVSRACEPADVLFHVAAKAGIWGDWDTYYQPNVIGTRNLLYACKHSAIRKFIYTSSPSVVFSGEPIRGGDEGLPYPEEWPFHYSHTKALAEQSVLEAHNPRGTGLSTVALRPHLVWGKGDPHIAPRLIAQARAGKIKRVGDGKNRVDMTHVNNVAQAHWKACKELDEGTCGGKAYFLSDGDPVRLWEWADALIEKVGAPPIRKSVSLKKAMKIGGVLEWVYRTFRLKGEPPLTRFVALQMAEDHWFDISAAREDFGYEPDVDRDAEMDRLAESLRE